ncbi:MAG: hypothetical protein CVU14_08735 [Bacteroidetes bacterium HGW-Bacteroidetes-9]|nr:MAG: hypothetical protein CVU14_08735 [Bacteroidetes bacterium HGW-Bacteroidetes-9]
MRIRSSAAESTIKSFLITASGGRNIIILSTKACLYGIVEYPTESFSLSFERQLKHSINSTKLLI